MIEQLLRRDIRQADCRTYKGEGNLRGGGGNPGGLPEFGRGDL